MFSIKKIYNDFKLNNFIKKFNKLESNFKIRRIICKHDLNEVVYYYTRKPLGSNIEVFFIFDDNLIIKHDIFYGMFVGKKLNMLDFKVLTYLTLGDFKESMMLNKDIIDSLDNKTIIIIVDITMNNFTCCLFLNDINTLNKVKSINNDFNKFDLIDLSFSAYSDEIFNPVVNLIEFLTMMEKV